MQRPSIRIASVGCASTGQQRDGSVHRPSSSEDAVARSEANCHEFSENSPAPSTPQTHRGTRYRRDMCAVQPTQQVGMVCRRSEKCEFHPLGSRINCQHTCGLGLRSGSDSCVCPRTSRDCSGFKSPDDETIHLRAARGKSVPPLREVGKSVSAPSTCGHRVTEAAGQTALLSTSLPLERRGALGANQRGPAAPSPTPQCELGTTQKEFDATVPSLTAIVSSTCSVSDVNSGCCRCSCGARSPTEVSSFNVWSCESGKKTFDRDNAKLAGVRNLREISPALSASIQTKRNLKRQRNGEGSSLLENTARENDVSKRTENASILTPPSASLTEEQPFSHIRYINALLESTEAQGRSGGCFVASLGCCGRDPTSPSEVSLQDDFGLAERVAAWDPFQEDNYALSAPGELELHDFDISDPRCPPSPVRHEDAPPQTAKTCMPTSSNAQRVAKAVPTTCTDLGIYEDMKWFTEASSSHAPPGIVTGASASGAVSGSMSGRRRSADAEGRRHYDTPTKQSHVARPGRQSGFHFDMGTIETTEAFSAGSPTSPSHVANGGGRRVAKLSTVRDFSEDGTQAEVSSGTSTLDDYSPMDSPNRK